MRLSDNCKKELSALNRSTNAQKAGVKEQFKTKVELAKHDRNEVLMQIDQEHERERKAIIAKHHNIDVEPAEEVKPQLLHL